MQGMIMHHAQAVEMTALIELQTQNNDLRLLGARISKSQSDEIKFMKRWLEARGEPVEPPMPGMPSMNMPGMDMSKHQMLMPGMLTPKQMDALRKAKGAEFDHLFLTGMIQHHNGALIMVKDLFDTAGAGQDAELFSFATDVDSGQRAEIRIMQTMLGENLEIQFAAEIEQAFETHPVKIFIANSRTRDWIAATCVIHGWGLPKHGVASNPLNPQLAGIEGLTACQEPAVRVLPVGTIWTTIHRVEGGYGKTGAIVVGMPHPLDAQLVVAELAEDVPIAHGNEVEELVPRATG